MCKIKKPAPAPTETGDPPKRDNNNHTTTISSSGRVCNSEHSFFAGCYFYTQNQKEVESMGKSPKKNVRVQAYWYTDETGKRHYKSFTAPTKKQAKLLADKWKAVHKDERPEEEQITVCEAVKRYIEMKEGIISPSTQRGYEKELRCNLSGIFGNKIITKLTTPAVQLWISDLSRRGLSPKSIRNAYGLLSATIDMFAPDLRLKVTLPARKKPELYCPSDQDVKRLLEAVNDPELYLAILLAAFGPMRRGEICALESTDIKDNIISVSKSMVLGSDNIWHIKQPKTYGGYRDIEFPDFVIQCIPHKEGKIFDATPDQITGRFEKALSKTDLPAFRFHDLRHYAASIMHAIGIPDQYILQRGGWSSDSVMKTVYRNTIDLETVRQNKKINDHFKRLSV